MLKVVGRTLLEHKFDILEGMDEIILIIGYQGDVIRQTYGEAYKGVPLRYVEQETLDGSMGALALARPYLSGRFLVMAGDDIYAREDVERAQRADDWVMIVDACEQMAAGGKVITNDEGEVVGIEEGDHHGQPGLMNTNMFALTPDVFEYPMVPKSAGSHEYGLPQTVLAAAKANGTKLHAIQTAGWIQITAPEDIAAAERSLAIEDTAPRV